MHRGNGRALRWKESHRVGSQPLAVKHASNPRCNSTSHSPARSLGPRFPGRYLRSRCRARSPWAMAFWSTSCGIRRPLSSDASGAEAERCGVRRGGAGPSRGWLGGASEALHPLLAGGKYRKTAAFHRSIAARQIFFCLSLVSFMCLLSASSGPRAVCVLPPR